MFRCGGCGCCGLLLGAELRLQRAELRLPELWLLERGGCGCGGDKSDAKPAEPAKASSSALMPVPPRPMADPNASVGQSREVVRTSFVR